MREPTPGTRKLELVPYTPELDDAILAFNERLASGDAGVEFRLRAGPGPLVVPPDAEGLWEERYLAVEGDVVRGGVFLQVQPFFVEGERCTVANIQLPLSEGIVDRRYAHVGIWLIKQVLRRHPRCFALGMGGEDRPLPQLLRALGFSIWTVPFFFMLGNVTRAARELRAVGPPARRRAASTVLRFTGTGALASAVWRRRVTWRTSAARGIAARRFDEWDAWADGVWEQARSSFSVAAVRDVRALRVLFPADDEQFPPFRLEERGRPVGWVVVGLTRMTDNPHFGSLAVGTIVDALTLPGHELAAVRVASQLLLERGADVVVTNQSHPAWCRACRRAGLVGGPSNYVLAASPALLPPGVDVASHGVQFTRGDGDGRVHL